MSTPDRHSDAGQPQSSDSVGRRLAAEQLVFGIVALQNNLITRDQLVAAFDAWVQDKSHTLPDVLQSQGALTGVQRGALQNLVEIFLAKHGSNAEKSLGALSSIPQVAPELEKLGDPDLFASLGHVAVDSETTLPYREFGSERFRILRPHATGGLGQVSVALDQELHREVALKELLPRHADNPINRERFLQEAEITGGLEHPGIIPIYALGQGPDGRPFYAMRFVKGDSLKAAIETFHRLDNPNRNDPGTRQLALRQLLGRFIDVCHAIDYAHSRGVLHRDLKPGNIMLGKHGETLVVDWGLAKSVGRNEIESEEVTLVPVSSLSSSGQTQPGSAIGTPSYMSPEQAAGQLDDLKPTTDVYCLGATLYHVLTGKPPLDKDKDGDVAGILSMVQRGDFRAPRAVLPEIPRELDAICLKAMALKPADRYPSAAALANDLERWLADEPVSAAPDLLHERISRFARKHRGYVQAGALAIALVALVSTLAAFLIDKQRWHNARLADENAGLAESERQAKTAAQELAQERGQLAERNARLADDERTARLATERHLRIATAERLAALAHATRPQSPEIGVTLAIESGLATLRDETGLLPASHQALLDSLSVIGGKPLVGHRGPIQNVEISPDGRWIVTASRDNTVRLWDLSAENPAADSRILLGESLETPAVAFSADSRWIVTAGQSLRLWDLTAADPAANHRVLNGGQGSFSVTCLTITPDRRRVVAGDFNGSAFVWDLADPDARPRVLAGHQKNIECLAVSADSRWLATGGGDGVVRLWDLAAGDFGVIPRLLKGHTDQISSLAFSPDGRHLVTGSYDETARIWDLNAADPAAESRVLSHPRVVGCVGISPDGRWIVTGSDQARIWDLGAEGSAAESRLLVGHQQAVRSVAFSRDSQMVVTGSWDKTAIVWNITQTEPTERAVLAGHSAEIDCVAVSPDSRWVVTGGRDHAARLWDLEGACAAANPRVLRVDRPHIHDVAISPNGRWLVTGGNDARVWDLEAANAAANPYFLSGYRGVIQGVAISPDSRLVVAACHDHVVRVWSLMADPADGPQRELSGHVGLILDVAFSPDGRWIVAGSADKTARVWDLTAADPSAAPRVLHGHQSSVHSATFSPDSRRVVTVAGAAYVWDLSSNEPLAPPLVLSDGKIPMIQCAAFSPDGRWVAACSADRTAYVWDLSAPDPAATPRLLKGHRSGIYALAFSPDGRTLFTGSADNTARIWNLTDGDPAATSKILSGHQAIIRNVAVTPDGRWLVTGSDDRTARIWDVAAHNPGVTARILRGHASTVNGLVIAPDSQHIVTWSYDRTVRIWRWKWDDLVELAGAVGRNLDGAEWNEYFPGQPYRKTFRDLPAPGVP
jgi:WD40 repeat protein/serine/threonine protein kinase